MSFWLAKGKLLFAIIASCCIACDQPVVIKILCVNEFAHGLESCLTKYINNEVKLKFTYSSGHFLAQSVYFQMPFDMLILADSSQIRSFRIKSLAQNPKILAKDSIVLAASSKELALEKGRLALPTAASPCFAACALLPKEYYKYKTFHVIDDALGAKYLKGKVCELAIITRSEALRNKFDILLTFPKEINYLVYQARENSNFTNKIIGIIASDEGQSILLKRGYTR